MIVRKNSTALMVLMCTLLNSTSAFAIAGLDQDGNENGVIDQQFIDLGAQFGNTVGFIDLGDGTGTGILVPSSVPGELKFLTAAHNLDSNNDGVLDNNSAAKIYFGATPGLDGAGATFSIDYSPSQVVVNSNWANSGGSATHDLAVITFNVSDIQTIIGGGDDVTLKTTQLNTANPLNQNAIVVGHGLHGDGTVPLSGAVKQENNVDGVLKAGENVIGFVGTPDSDFAGVTVSPASGDVVLLDLQNDDGTGSFFNNPIRQLEAGTASGDSGGPLLIDMDGDGNREVVGILNGGDNSINGGGASEFGDLSQYAGIFTSSNQEFLNQQSIFLGSQVGETSIAGIASIDLAAISTAQTKLNRNAKFYGPTLVAAKQKLRDQTSVLRERKQRIARGEGLLNRIESAHNASSLLRSYSSEEKKNEVKIDSYEVSLAASENPNWEAFLVGSYANSEENSNGTSESINGAVGLEMLIDTNRLFGVSFGTSEGDIEQISASAYTIAKHNEIISSFGYTFTDLDINRTSQSLNQKLSGGGSVNTLNAEFTMAMKNDSGFTFSPYLNVAYSWGKLDNLNSADTSTGAVTNISNVEVNQYDLNMGAQLSTQITSKTGLFIPFLGASLSIIKDTGNNSEASELISPFMEYAQDNAGNISLQNSSRTISANSAIDTSNDILFSTISGGSTFVSDDNWSLTGSGEVYFSDDNLAQDYALSMGLNYKF